VTLNTEWARRSEAWVLAKRARQFLDGSPMTEVSALSELQDRPACSWRQVATLRVKAPAPGCIYGIKCQESHGFG
jgi:hypothetical protein